MAFCRKTNLYLTAQEDGPQEVASKANEEARSPTRRSLEHLLDESREAALRQAGARKERDLQGSMDEVVDGMTLREDRKAALPQAASGDMTGGSTESLPEQTDTGAGLDREVILEIVRRHKHEVLYCYEMGLQRNRQLHGRVAVQWTIDENGAVSSATIRESSLENPSVENCIIARVNRWRFPEPRDGKTVRVTYPWILSPRR